MSHIFKRPTDFFRYGAYVIFPTRRYTESGFSNLKTCDDQQILGKEELKEIKSVDVIENLGARVQLCDKAEPKELKLGY